MVGLGPREMGLHAGHLLCCSFKSLGSIPPCVALGAGFMQQRAVVFLRGHPSSR